MRDEPDPAPVRGVGARQRRAVEEDLAPLRPQQAGEDPQQRRLAGAVGAEDRQRVAGVQREAHAAQRPHVAEAPLHRPHLERGRRAAAAAAVSDASARRARAAGTDAGTGMVARNIRGPEHAQASRARRRSAAPRALEDEAIVEPRHHEEEPQLLRGAAQLHRAPHLRRPSLHQDEHAESRAVHDARRREVDDQRTRWPRLPPTPRAPPAPGAGRFRGSRDPTKRGRAPRIPSCRCEHERRNGATTYNILGLNELSTIK